MTYDDFIAKYPEFKGLSQDVFLQISEKIKCFFPEYSDYTQCNNIVLSYLLIAHFLVIEGRVTSLGINKPSGVVSSSSVGGVSVSMQTAPYKTSSDYFFHQTPYGLEYLAYLSQVCGMFYVN